MKVFRDPIHNVINLDTGDKIVNKLIIDIIDSKEFQRLRFIRQLGFSYLSYPSANNTRFEHSLGTAFLAIRFLDKILSIEDDKFANFIGQVKKDKPLTVVAALLHDIGHGALSHVSEELITHRNHEQWGKAILLGDTQINKLLRAYDNKAPQIICDLLDVKTPASKILSGQLDVDRIDYLLRDSHMTGSGYGKFDVEWLINVLTIGDIGNGQIEIGVDYSKGASVAEDFLMARSYMFKNVYLHKTTLIAQEMVKLLFKRVKEIGVTDMPKNIKNIYFDDSTSLDDYLSITDIDFYYFLKQLRNSSDEITKSLADKILNRDLTEKSFGYYVTKIAVPSKQKDDIYLFDKKGSCYKLSDFFAVPNWTTELKEMEL